MQLGYASQGNTCPKNRVSGVNLGNVALLFKETGQCYSMGIITLVISRGGVTKEEGQQLADKIADTDLGAGVTVSSSYTEDIKGVKKV